MMRVVLDPGKWYRSSALGRAHVDSLVSVEADYRLLHDWLFGYSIVNLR
jgi:hypothetical protein